MKKANIILVLFLIVSTGTLFGQSLHSLDLKNGFRHFKLGTSPNEIEDIEEVTFIKEMIEQEGGKVNPNYKTYSYKGDKIKTVSGIEVTSVSLEFYKNKLYRISISFGYCNLRSTNFTIEQFNVLLANLESVYGRIWNGKISEEERKDNGIQCLGGTLNRAIWEGNKVRLILERKGYTYGPALEPYTSLVRYAYIVVEDKKISREIISDQF